MVHKNIIERRKEEKQKKRKAPSKILDDQRDTRDSEVIMAEPEESKSEPVAQEMQIQDRLDFKLEGNTLSILYIRLNNRQYRLKIMLNDETEIRPATYLGLTPGNSFWKLLKASLKTA